VEKAKNDGSQGVGQDLAVNVEDIRNYIDHNRAKYAPLQDGAFTVPVLNIYFEKTYNVAIPLVVGGIAASTNDGEGWGQIDNLNERSVYKAAIDCSKSAPVRRRAPLTRTIRPTPSAMRAASPTSCSTSRPTSSACTVPTTAR